MAIYINSDNLLTQTVKDQDGTAVTGATVEATVLESDATTEVGGMTFPVAFSDDGGGSYSATLEDTLELNLGKLYWIRVDISGGGAQDQRWQREQAERRGFND